VIDFKKVVILLLERRFQKVVVEAKRMRVLDDHLKTMIKRNEVPCVIEGREEFNDVDIVIDRF
jgi:hypothetical protein